MGERPASKKDLKAHTENSYVPWSGSQVLAKARMCAESVSVCAEGRKQCGSARLNLPAAFLPNAFVKRNGTTFSSQTSEALVALTPPTP